MFRNTFLNLSYLLKKKPHFKRNTVFKLLRIYYINARPANHYPFLIQLPKEQTF